eukprot:TRINITY_DN2192_c0_g1_i3.p1 TRINITY_DN2192_c0_g1~~TRINITY_DN2192_c0_g1_i3.p1  ORF type:complete len:392 (+),score=45.66 TRINITY_DN2192_c0_g1_i3:1067-2242(+)
MSPFDLLFKKKKKKRHPLLGRRQGEQGWLEDGARLLKEVISSCDGRGCYPVQMFSAKEIEEAIGQPYQTQGFYNDYEGTHEDRQIIIKVYRIEERELAFNEIATVTQIKHANVAKLLGCCLEMEQPILIYEKVPFMLRNCIRQVNPSSLISWEHRLRIAVEIAYAITYLHIGASRPIVHRGITSCNILLDEHCKPKLCDFSLSITIPFGETHVKLNRIVGMYGYMDPDCLNTSTVSEKSDVYSYGVLLLELLSGMRPFVPEDDGTTKDMVPLLYEFIRKESTEKEERLDLILHNGLSMDVRQVEQAMACIQVAVGCTSRNPDERPEMKEVAQQLEQIERGELPLSSSLLRVQATGSSYSEGFSHGDVSQPRSITLPFDKISSDMDSESIIG